MPAPRHPALIQDRITELETARATHVEHLYDMHGSAQWEACASTAIDLIALDAELRSLRWALGNA